LSSGAGNRHRILELAENLVIAAFNQQTLVQGCLGKGFGIGGLCCHLVALRGCGI